MKKFLFLLLTFFMLCALPERTQAGEINTEEQVIIDTMSSGFDYHGKTYVATKDYINKVEAYLKNDDVDLSASDVSIYLSTYKGSIYSYIRDGYLVEKDLSTLASADSSPSDSATPTPNTENKTSDSEINNNTSMSPQASVFDNNSDQATASSTNEIKTSADTDSTSAVNSDTTTDAQQASDDTTVTYSSTDSFFQKYLESDTFIIIIFIFIFIAVLYIAFNREVIFHLSSFLKMIISYIAVSLFLFSGLFLLFFSNYNLFDRLALKDCYYESINSEIKDYMVSDADKYHLCDDISSFCDKINESCFSTSSIKNDTLSYIKGDDASALKADIISRVTSSVEDYTKDNTQNCVSITSDNCTNWIYNISDYYYNCVSFDYMKNVYSAKDRFHKSFIILVVITGILILMDIRGIFTADKKRARSNSVFFLSALLLAIPTLMTLTLLADVRFLSDKYVNYDYAQKIYAQHIVNDFKATCINSAFSLVIILVILSCILYLSGKYNSTNANKSNS